MFSHEEGLDKHYPSAWVRGLKGSGGGWIVLWMRILLGAFSISPFLGSEPGLGWRVASGLSRHHDVTVLCGDLHLHGPTEQGLAPLREYIQAQGFERLTLEYVPPPVLARGLHFLHPLPGLWPLYYPAYRHWQRAAEQAARRLHRIRSFDLVHQLNLIGYREPGFLWRMGIPFFWGPISGSATIPAPFFREMRGLQKWRWMSRNVLNPWQSRGSRRCRSAARVAKKVWAVSREDQRMVQGWGAEADLMLEVGADVDGTPRTRPFLENLQLVWSGRCDAGKALPILFHALRLVEGRNPSLKFSVDVLGDGPEKERWFREWRQMNLRTAVRWLGMLPRDEALAVMRQKDVLILTSLKEATASVTLEALSMGMPVICHDACGMAVAVTPACGIKVPMIDPATSAMGFAGALEKLGLDPGLLPALSAGAGQRALELSWKNKINQILAAYQAAGDFKGSGGAARA